MADKLSDRLKAMEVNKTTLVYLAGEFSTTFKHLALHSREQFLATPITKLSTGEEIGKFMAIDFGGTNLRVGFVQLLGLTSSHASQPNLPCSAESNPNSKDTGLYGQIKRSHERVWPIGNHLKLDKAEDLFSWIGHCMAQVVAAEIESALLIGEDAPKEIPLGIAFSFPMMQKTMDAAAFMPMGKGFAITSKLNLGEMLLAGYKKHTTTSHQIGSSHRPLPSLKIIAIVNDTIATLASLAYLTGSSPMRKAAIGLIVGTGCNATIPMHISDLHVSKHPIQLNGKSIDTVLVNTEWGIKGAASPLRSLNLITRWDKILDNATTSPGFQPFEYMVAGHYLGELVRIIVYDYFTTHLQIEEITLPPSLLRRNSITTTFLTKVIAPAGSASVLASTLNTTNGLANSKHWQWTPTLAEVFQRINQLVVRRSAAMIASAIVGLLDCAGELKGAEPVDHLHVKKQARSDHLELVVACTGGLILQYEGYMAQVQQFVDDIIQSFVPVDRKLRVLLCQAPDGGIIGAGVVAGTVSAHQGSH